MKDLKKAVVDNKIVVGLKSVKKMIGKVKKVYVSRNCAEDLSELCKLAGVELNVLDVSSAELGVLCRKPFSVSAVAI